MTLRGNWRFYYDQLLESFPKDSTGYTVQHVPDVWTNYELDGKQLPSFGHATYEVSILCPQTYNESAIEIKGCYSAFRLYLNGELIRSSGKVGTSAANSSHSVLPSVSPLALAKGENLLRLEISNYQHNKGGFYADVIIGSKSFLSDKRNRQALVDMFVIGSLTMIGLFFLGMYAFWRKDLMLLYNALFCLFQGLRIGFFGRHVLAVDEASYWVVNVHIEYLAFYLANMFLLLFFSQSYKDEIANVVRKMWVVVSLFFLGCTVALPLHINSMFLPVYLVLATLMSIYATVILTLSVVRRVHGSIMATVSWLLLIMGVASTGLVYFNIVTEVLYLGLYNLLSYLMMAFVTAQGFGRSFKTLEELQEETSAQKDEIETDKNIIEKQAEKLKEISEVQTRWFTNIAHELRTPLMLILGPIRQFLNTHSSTSTIGIENIQLAEKNSVSLLRLVNEILDISRLESNQLKLNKKAVNLSSLIRETTMQFDSVAKQKGITLKMHIMDDVDLMIDKDRIQNILMNLISNAMKFTHAGEQVKISVAIKFGDGVEIFVEDTGDGIPEKDLPYIFERYYQADAPNRMNHGGAGIGLALCQELAELHGGKLSANSELGIGSTFSLFLPQLLVNNVESTAESQPFTLVSPSISNMASNRTNLEVSNDQHQKPRILLVEDNTDMRQYIMGFMSASYHIMEAADGIEALECLKETIPDLIISDLMMPRMDGMELAKQLKCDEKYKLIPFITLTAKATESHKIETLRIGIDDYLVKPFNAEELKVRAVNLINNYKQRMDSDQAKVKEEKEPSYHDKLLEGMKGIVMDQLSNCSFTIEDLALSQNMSTSSLKRVIKKASGLSPGKFIREIRMLQANQLLEHKQYATVQEVVHAVGFENASHFTQLFYERFGKRPSDYL
ncbi:MAG: ATP-binding protein [Reichenbachiella sp.]